ncbi:MAG: VWA domain-containing protein [Hylemonella sp.]|nr:VWA domain-containing protein [Hylemonella sp.]MDP1936718.1 VWA domain-containing protein [Hylemonella sp.]
MGRADADTPTVVALGLLLGALSRHTLTLQTLGAGDSPSPASATTPRAVLSTTHLLLPAAVMQQATLARAAIAHAAAHLLYSPPAQAAGTLKPLGLAVASAIEDARVEALLMQRLPGVRRWFLQAQPAHDPHGLDVPSLLARLGHALLNGRYADGNHWVHKGRTLFAATRHDHGLEDHAAFRRLASILANDLGQMRVRLDPQQCVVPAAYRDDHSYLWQHGATADHATEVLQVQTPVAPPPPADASPADTPPTDAEERPDDGICHLYPEWDYRLQRERADWCTVREAVPPAAAPGGLQPAAEPTAPWRSRRRLSRNQRLRRQWEGEDLDLDAAIDVQVERRLALAPDGRLFVRPGSEAPRCSVLVLLDLSASTGDVAASSAQPLLAVEQQAALLLARAAQAGQDRIAIHGFASNTRAAVHYLRLLDFGTPLDAVHTQRILSTRAAGSTRIGAALRHATRCLLAEPAGPRAIVLVTDGAPSDVDVFDARYLTEDARAAVLAARRQGVQCHGLVVDAGADRYVHRIFGWRGYRVVARAAQLPRALQAIHEQLSA